MKALLRPLFVGGLSIAIAGATFLGSSTVALAATKPTFTSLSVTTPVNEGDRPTVTGTFSDPDTADQHSVVIFWGDGSMDSYTLPVGDRSFSLQKSVGYPDDGGASNPLLMQVQLNDPQFSVSRFLNITVNNVAPSWDSFGLSATAVDAGSSVTASGLFSDPGTADTHVLTVDWGDGTPVTTMNLARRVWAFTTPAHTYTASGTWTVSARIADDEGAFADATSTIVVNGTNQPPTIASFAVTPGDEGAASSLALAFADADAGDSHTVSVSWGDGQSDAPVVLAAGVTRYSATHVFADTGSYAVSLTLSDSFGNSVTTDASVSPTNVPPTLGSLTLTPASVVDHQAVTVSGGFTDPGTNDTFTLTIEWGDGQTWTAPLAANERTFAVSHTYANPGAVRIRVNVADRDNGPATSTVDLDVLPNHAPTDLRLNPSTVDGGSLTLGVSFTDVDTADTHSVFVSWGDGSSDTYPLAAGASSLDATHSYVDSGSYTLSVSVSDNGGKSVSGGVTVSTNVAPSLDPVIVSPSSVVAGDPVTVFGLFADPDANDTFTLAVNWGDQTAVTTQSLGTAREYSAGHSYANAGQYVIDVTVTDRDGGSGFRQASVVVSARNTGPSNLVLTASTSGLSATVRGTFVDPDAADTHSVTYNWGDGSTATWPVATGARSYSWSHTYAASGRYTVTVKVTDAAGLWTSASTNVAVTTSVSDLLDRMSALVKTFGLDRNVERWLLHKIDDLKASLAFGNSELCADLKTLGHLDAFADRTLTDDQLAALRSLSTQIGTAAGCASTAPNTKAPTATPKATVKPTTTDRTTRDRRSR